MTFKSNISLCSLAVRNEPIETVVERLAAIGYNAIELFYSHVERHSDQQLEQLRARMQELGIRPLVISPYFFLTRDTKAYAETMETARRAIDIARKLWIPKVRTFTDAGPDALPSEKATDLEWAQCIRGLREMTAMAPELDFVVETHQNSLANTQQSCRRLIQETNVPNLHLNFQHTEEFLRDGYIASVDALFPWITHMHLAQAGEGHSDHWIEEDGPIDFSNLFRHLEEKGYKGTFSIEYCWQNIPWARAESGFRFVKDLIGNQ